MVSSLSNGGPHSERWVLIYQVGWLVSRPGGQGSGSPRNKGREAPVYRTTVLCDTCSYLCPPVLCVVLPRACSLASAGAGTGQSSDYALVEEVVGLFSCFWLRLQPVFSAALLPRPCLQRHTVSLSALGFPVGLGTLYEPLLLRHSAELRTFTLKSVMQTW